MIDTTLSTFERDVIEGSLEVPVIVDFWAPWCGPCQQLGPMLEKLEREYGGRFKLVNVNADTNPELVASFNLKSLPYTVAFLDGNAVAQFMGAQPEAFVRAFIDRLSPNPANIEHRAAREALARGQSPIAEDYLRNAIALDPSHAAARLDLMSMLLDRQDFAAAERHFAVLTRAAVQESTYAVVSARMETARKLQLLPPIEVLVRRICSDAGDLGARYELAELLVARGDYGPAMHQLLEIVKRDRAFRNDAARTRMLEVFEMAAADEPLVQEYRTRLSSLLF